MERNILNIGRGVIQSIEKELSQNGAGGKYLYVSDSMVDGLYGETVKSQVRNVGTLKEAIVEQNSISQAMDLAERIIATNVDFLVGIGGGKVLDVCKYAAYVSKIPLLSIPTTAANDGLASPVAVLTRKDGLPRSLGCKVPSMLLVDTEIIQSSPIKLIKAGIGDTISNFMALKDWQLACQRGQDEMNGYAYLLAGNALNSLLNSSHNKINHAFIEMLVESLVISGIAMDFAGSSRPVSGAEHLFSHAMDYYCPHKNLHGIQVALGTIAIAKLTGIDYQPELEYLQRFEVDIVPSHLQIDKDMFVKCIQQAPSMRPNRYTCLNECDLNKLRLERLYEELEEELQCKR